MSTRDPSWSSSQDREMDELLALGPAAREARLAEIARERPERAQRLRRWLAAVAASVGALEPAPADGRRFGPWRAIRLVGRGGMGEVYSGERADGAFERRVAIKRMRPDRAASPAQLARERALHAGLDHPGIARLLDGGTLDDGSPWLVTEWIEGDTLDGWIAARPRSRRERVALLRDVCAAIAYAHAHLVVHRDLKPANVMVDEQGRAHVVDFGIARALDEDRAHALTDDRAMTPAFAAPEQLTGGAITTRTDVYSLGVLLYWLLTDRVPHDPATLPLAAFVERVTAGDAVPPTRGTDAPDRDLDAIATTAMSADADARYASADALGADLDRWLSGDDVAAREPTRRERVVRFLRRYRVQSALAAALVVALVAGLASTAWQAREAAAQRDVARRERDTALLELERGSALVDAFGAVLRDSGEDERLDANGWLDRAVATAAAPGPADTVARTRLLAELADIEFDRGQPQRALALLDRALAVPGALDAPGEARVRCLRAGALATADRVDEASAELARGVALAERLTGAQRIELVECLARRADIVARLDRSEEDVAAMERALRELDAIGGGEPQRWRRAALLHKLGLTLQVHGRTDEALARFRAVHALDERLGTADTPDGASTQASIAALAGELGALPDAAASYASALAIIERTRGRSALFATTLRNAAVVENQRGAHASAAALAQRSVDVWRELGVADGAGSALALLELGRARLRLGELDAAEAALVRAGELFATQQKPNPYLADLVAMLRAQVRIAGGDEAGAGMLLAAVRARLAGSPSASSESALLPIEAELARARHDWPAAEGAARRALATLGTEFRRPHWRIELLQSQLARALLEQGRRDEARLALADAPAQLAKVFVPDDPRLAEARGVESALAKD